MAPYSDNYLTSLDPYGIYGNTPAQFQAGNRPSTPDFATNPTTKTEANRIVPPGTATWFSGINPQSNEVGKLSRQGILDLTTFDTSGILRDLIAQLSAPGGPLSSVQESQRFGALSTGTQKALESSLGDLFRAIHSGGFSPGRARGALRAVSFDAMRDLLGRRAELIAERQGQLGEYQTQLANSEAAQEIAQKDRTLSAIEFQVTGDREDAAARRAARSNVAGGLIQGVGSLLGGLFG